MSHKTEVNRLAIQYCSVKETEPEKAKTIAEEIIQLQEPLVIYLSKKLSCCPKFDDEIALAIKEGLFLSLQSFDPNYGIKYTTYSYEWTYQYAKTQYKLLIHQTDKKGRADVLFAYYAWKIHHLDQPDENFAKTFKSSMTPEGILKHIQTPVIRFKTDKGEKNIKSNISLERDIFHSEMMDKMRELPSKANLTSQETSIMWRFMNGERFHKIAEDYPFTPQYCQQVKTKAIKKIQMFLENHPTELNTYKELMD